MSHISVIKLPDNSTYDIKDSSAISVNEKGAANGVVPLNGSSKIESTYLPSYVDDVIEGYYYNEKFWKESTHTTEITGEAGKIYINLETNPATTYRYSGSTFVQIGSGGSVVTITRDLTSGTKSATINVNGTDFDLYSTNDTTYESKDPVSGGTAVSLVTTGEKANWNAKTSNTGTVTQITAGTGLTGGEITTSGTIALDTSGVSPGSYGPGTDAEPAYGATFNVPYVTVDAYGRVTAVSNKTVKIPASDNTWRGIQDNLTSSSSTTESLSAKQGYLLANGSARDNTKLALTGGNVTGAVSFGDSVSIDSLNAGNAVITGSASVTNNLQVNTINGVAVGSNPKFTDNNTTYSAGTGLSLNGTTFSVKTGYTTSGNNRAVQADDSGNLYVVQKDNNTTYSAGTGLSLSSTTFSLATSGATAGSYGDSAAQTPAYGGTFKVPYVTVDTYGRVTGISEHTVKIPASDNTDTKLQVAAVTSGTTYYPIVGTGTTAATRQYDTTGFSYKATDGTTSSTGNATLYLGNTSSSTTAGNKRGRLLLYGSGATYYHLIQGAPTANRTITLPDATGTVHLASNPTLKQTGTATIDLAASTAYTLTAGGGSVVFTTPPNTTYSAMSAAEITAGTATSKQVMRADYLKAGILNLLHPIGSVYITSTNTNPSSTLGGTWTLVDKEFKSQNLSPTLTYNTSYTQASKVKTVFRSMGGHSVHIRVRIELDHAVTSTSGTQLISWDATQLGFTNADQVFVWYPASVDSIKMEMRATNVAVYGANTVVYGTYILTALYSGMVDSFCDKFYWKRTA